MAYNNLGGMLKMQGRATEAIACYEHVALLQVSLPPLCIACCAHLLCCASSRS